MKKVVVGIDVSKDFFDFCELDVQNVGVRKRGKITNTETEIKKWLKVFNTDNYSFALEHTGHYGVALVKSLCESGFITYLINPLELKKSLGIQRGKTDRVDAYRIAEYSITNNHKLKPFDLPSDSLVRLKALLTARQRYVKISVQIQNSLKANQLLNKSVDVKDLIKEEKRQLKTVDKTINAVEKAMIQLIKEDQKLKTSYDKITKVVGVGPIIALKIICETENFLKYSNPRKFCCHSGLAPFPYQSGTSIKGKTKTHYLRDRSLKALLTRGATTAVQHDPQLKMYYNRKREEGKHHMSVINAVANKLVLRIFAVAKRQEPFVKLTA